MDGILGIPHVPVGTEAWGASVDQGADSFASGPVVGEVVDGQVGDLRVDPVEKSTIKNKRKKLIYYIKFSYKLTFFLNIKY